MDSTPTISQKPNPTTSKYWARAEIYEPFRFGGPLWHWYKYEIAAADVEEYFIAGIRVFVYFDTASQRFVVHELFSGGWLGENADEVVVGGAANEAARWRALGVAKKNIEDTPDIKEQTRELGPATDLPSYGAGEILKRLAKTRKDRKGQRNA